MTLRVKVQLSVADGLPVCADFNSSDKLAVEMFSEPENPAQLISEVVQHLVSPGSGGVGGDSRLALPSGRDLKTETSTIAGQVQKKRTNIRFFALLRCLLALLHLLPSTAAMQGCCCFAGLHLPQLSISNNHQIWL